MLLRGRKIYGGIAEGEVLVTLDRISFLEGIDPRTGKIVQKGDAEGKSISGRVFAFRGGKGSTVGIYTIYGLKYYGNAPLGFITTESDEIVACGSAVISVPYLSEIPIEALSNGDRVLLNADEGYLEIKDVDFVEVSTSFLMRDEKVAIFRRSDRVSTYRNKWAGISGKIEANESPMMSALREIEEETGIKESQLRLLSQKDPLYIRDGKVVWKVYPFLWELKENAKIELQWENVEYRWVSVEDVKNFDCVPKLYETLIRLIK